MYINIEEVNRNDFQVQERFLDGVGKVYLITPTFEKHRWSEGERHLRSLLLDESFKVISSSLMKFHNYGEHPEIDQVVDKAIQSGNAVFPVKMDGSLLIRSVINGKVYFRTRGSHTMGEDFEGPIMELIRTKYPNLLLPQHDARYSLLFEYTSPTNQIVVKYAEPCLTVLGAMDLTAEPPEFVSSPFVVSQLEKTYGTPAVQFHHLEGSLPEIMEEVRGWKGVEGIVIWATLGNGKMVLCKVKSTEYMKIHTLKYQMSAERVKQFCWYRNIETLEQFQNELFMLGIDWEAVSFVEPYFQSYIQRKAEVYARAEELIQQIKSEELGNLSRGEAARRLQEMTKGDPAYFHVGINYLYQPGKVQNLLDAFSLEISVNALTNFRKEASELAERLTR